MLTHFDGPPRLESLGRINVLIGKDAQAKVDLLNSLLKDPNSAWIMPRKRDGVGYVDELVETVELLPRKMFIIERFGHDLHHSLTTEMCQRLLTKLTGTGSQLFATTHNWDVLCGLNRVVYDNPNEGDVVVYRIDGDKSVRYSSSELRICVENDIEMR